MTSYSPVSGFKNFIRLVSKYSSTSLFATILDFGVFHLALKYFGAAAVLATLAGRIVGSSTSFVIHKFWVFDHIKGLDLKVLLYKYILGVIIGTILNLTGVWFLNSVLGLEPWPSRIITATSVWFIVFSYNRLWVFKKQPSIVGEID